jgi:hypothetical protein
MPKNPDAGILFALLCALAAQATPGATSDPLADIRHCAAESNDTRRLACYDKQFRILDTRAPDPTGPSSTPTPSAATLPTPASAAAVTTAPAPPAPITAPASPAPAASVPTAAAAAAEQGFGMNGQVERSNPTTRPPKIDHLAGRIASIRYKPRGEFILQLENGQVWEEADGENRVALEAGDAVTIDTGVMGAYWLGFGKHASVRVKRTH